MHSGKRFVRVLPETWVLRAEAFIRDAEHGVANPPRILFARERSLRNSSGHYAAYEIRSRQLRCVEAFFVETLDDERITALVAIEGMRTLKPVAHVSLLVCRDGDGDEATRLCELLDQVLVEAGRYSALQRLRFSYGVDSTLCETLGAVVCDTLRDPPLHVPLLEEARIPNEFGPGREAVLVAYSRTGAGTRMQPAAPEGQPTACGTAD